MRIVLTSIRCPWAEDSCRHNSHRRTKASSSNPNNGHVALVTNTTALHHFALIVRAIWSHCVSSPFTTDDLRPVVATTVYLGDCYTHDTSSRWQWQAPRWRLEWRRKHARFTSESAVKSQSRLATEKNHGKSRGVQLKQESHSLGPSLGPLSYLIGPFTFRPRNEPFFLSSSFTATLMFPVRCF